MMFSFHKNFALRLETSFFLPSSFLFFELHLTDAIGKLQSIHEEEKKGNKEETFESRSIGDFLKDAKIHTREVFGEHFRTKRLYNYLEFKKTQGNLTDSEEKLFAYYGTNKQNDLIPNIDDDLTRIEGQLVTTPNDSSLQTKQKELIDLKLLEMAGNMQIREHLGSRKFHSNLQEEVFGQGPDIMDRVSKIYQDGKKNFRKLPAVLQWGMILFGAYSGFQLLSGDDHGEKEKSFFSIFKNALKGTAKLGAWTVFGGTLFYLFTSKNPLTLINKFTSARTRDLDKMSRKFNCHQEEARILTDSIVCLDQVKYRDFAKWYPKAKETFDSVDTQPGENEFEKARRIHTKLSKDIPRQGAMEAWEVFIALHTAFKRYPEILEQYRDKPSMTFKDILLDKMVNDADPFFMDILKENYEIASNELRESGSGGIFERGRSIFSGTEYPDPLSEYNDAFSPQATKLAKFHPFFQQADTAGNIDTSSEEYRAPAYYEENKAAYYISRVHFTTKTDGSVDWNEEIKKAKNQAKTFLVTKGVDTPNLQEVYICTDDPNFLTVFLRAPLTGSKESLARNTPRWHGGNAKEMKNKTFLEEGASFTQLTQEKILELKLKFGLDDTEYAQFEQHILSKYAGLGWTEEEVIKKMWDKDEVKEAGIQMVDSEKETINNHSKRFDTIDEFVKDQLDDFDVPNDDTVAADILARHRLKRLECEHAAFVTPADIDTKLDDYKGDVLPDLHTTLQRNGQNYTLPYQDLLNRCVA